LPIAPGLAAAALPVRDATGRANASITIDGPVLRRGKSSLVRESPTRVEALILANPGRVPSPFAHINL
jgi:DNA-binding IclR family transcriptional regulator